MAGLFSVTEQAELPRFNSADACVVFAGKGFRRRGTRAMRFLCARRIRPDVKCDGHRPPLQDGRRGGLICGGGFRRRVADGDDRVGRATRRRKGAVGEGADGDMRGLVCSTEQGFRRRVADGDDRVGRATQEPMDRGATRLSWRRAVLGDGRENRAGAGRNATGQSDGRRGGRLAAPCQRNARLQG